MITKCLQSLCYLIAIICCSSALYAQQSLIHPGLSHKLSDLDRIKGLVEAQTDPYFTSFQGFESNASSSYDYVVRGNTSMTILLRDAPSTNLAEFESDSRAAYHNAIMWYLTGDERHAQKAIEIFNAWTGLTYIGHTGTRALTSSLIYIMLEGAEIIRHTYDGWSPEDIKEFEDMLVYPGYSNTEVPADLVSQGTWYWRGYLFDYVRAGNQELSAIRAILAIGIFMDNEIIYDRALRYVSGLTHRPDDLPYSSGPHTTGSEISNNGYQISYNYTIGDEIEDYGFNGVLTNYIWESGQSQESSRDLWHTWWGEYILCNVGEIAWNQGTDFWGEADSRILLGLEFNNRYTVSYVESYPDQPEPWEPTAESGEFTQRFDATGRTYSLAISPIYASDPERIYRDRFNDVESWELPIAHYLGRGIKTEDDVKWTMRAREKSIEMNGGYEDSPLRNNGAYLGWGALTFRRPDDCFGDPISGFGENGLPIFEMNKLPMTIKAENFDYFPIDGQERIYNDLSTGNSSGIYRTTDVDIDEITDGDYHLTSLESGEWLSYTIDVFLDIDYDIEIRYASANSDGQIRLTMAGQDIVSSTVLPSTGGNDIWSTMTIADDIQLPLGVMNMKLHIEGVSNSFELDYIAVNSSVNIEPEVAITAPHQNATFIESSEIEIEVDASDLDGQISKVEFYLEQDKLGEVTEEPYTFVWSDPTVGQHTFTVKAFDNMDAEVSDVVTIDVLGDGDDLVLYYDFDHNMVDRSGNSQDIELNNASLYVNGQLNSAVNFQGDSAYVKLPAGIADNVNDFTISLWVNAGEQTAFAPIFYFGEGSSSNMYLTPNPVTNRIRFGMTNASTSFQLNAPNVEDLPKDEWAHVAITVRGQTAVLYINGESITEKSFIPLGLSDLETLENNFIGIGSSTATLNGSVDDFKFYKRGLSTQEVKSEYEAGKENISNTGLTWISPTQEDEVVEGEVILSVESSDASTTIEKVEFYSGTSKIGEVLTSPYSLSYDDAEARTHWFSAVSFDDNGKLTTSEHTIIDIQTVNIIPTVAIQSPTDGAEFSTKEAIEVSVGATDEDGEIVKVEIFINDTLEQTKTDSPYVFTVDMPDAEGIYDVKAIVTDDRLGTNVSDVVSISLITVLSIEEELARILMYPNPSQGTIYVNSQSIVSYKLFNLSGKLMDQGTTETVENKIDISELENGIYVMSFNFHDVVRQVKIIKN